MASLLVIGGTGFFGKSILDSFQRGELNAWDIDKIIVMARNTERLIAEAPALLTSNVELVSSDITSAETIPFADYIIHAAASTDARNYLTRPIEERKNIQAGTLNYCRLAKKFHRNSKILFVSSGAVYGKQPSHIEAISEDYISISPIDMQDSKRAYAIAKRDAEVAIQQLGQEGLSVSIARCFAFVGTWLPRNQHFAIGNFIEDGLRNREILIKAQHPVYRTYMYADDLVKWLMTISHHSNQHCPIYNVGSDDTISIIDLAKLIAAQFRVSLTYASTINDETIDKYIPDIRKAKMVLGLQLNYKLKDSIINTINQIKKSR